ncbi:ATP-binding cassette domain-containing protein [Duganella sp. FT135W]|uniref:ATP-binding cassette domain-containing protein n=1 Tax=Duganella flavida TaxID=2692175 RepID=A0A6L8KEX8_9BURK|nr:ABC transporter ATP-binding protein [Duganella flavida]MYM24372.1 ATP-binding cassette domain-containing protein [Duganella flavida]
MPVLNNYALELRGLSKGFDRPVVNGLDLSVRCGEIYALLGANGAGKTTTLRMATGLLLPDTGTVSICGVDLHTEPEVAKRPLACLFDEPLLYGKLTALEYLAFVAGLWSLPAAQAAARAEMLLAMLGLSSHAQQLTETYSRGMKQKLAVAGALIHQPALIVMDEPLTGLDAHAARQVKDLLLQHTAAGGAVLMTTHILDVAERIADRIGILQGGRLIGEGSLAQLQDRAQQSDASLEDVFLHLTESAHAVAA